MSPWQWLLPLGIGLTMGSCASAPARESRTLFDGRTLHGWEITDFGGQGPVEVRDGTIVLHQGEPLTGITWREDFPRVGYEVTLQAMRLAGNDFFAAITFPVGDDPCTLVIGGWGGTVVGLSSIDGADASENETRRSMRFEDRRWYRIRLRVSDENIAAWIDEEQVVDFAYGDRLLSIRVDVWQSQPFGIATWRTTGALRDLELRMLPTSPSRAAVPGAPARAAPAPKVPFPRIVSRLVDSAPASSLDRSDEVERRKASPTSTSFLP